MSYKIIVVDVFMQYLKLVLKRIFSVSKSREMPQDGIKNFDTHSVSWESILGDGEFKDQVAYDEALQDLVSLEKRGGFDAEVIATSSEIEVRAARILKKIIALDDEQVYRRESDVMGQEAEKRCRGRHFLGNVDLINKTELIKVAKKMPKGAHLHIHFNSCLSANFLVHLARNKDAMYISSTLPLTTTENMALAQISFMVMTLHEATHIINSEGVEVLVPLGNVWEEDYIPNSWMPYEKFHTQFDPYDKWTGKGKNYGLERTLAAETWLVEKIQFSEDEAHNSKQTCNGIWEKFNHRTKMMKGLFAYESAFRLYTDACIRDFVEDNIQYAEIRPNFMKSNSLKKDDGNGSIGNQGILEIVKDQTNKTINELQKEGKFFGGLKVIYCTPRSFQREQVAYALNECIELKRKYKDLICGFDLVGHEEKGNQLRLFIPEFLDFRKKCKEEGLDIPFLFHCGETLIHGGKVDGNLYDAILLNAKRIGHGYCLARHPLLMEILKKKGIAIESCPISNEILGLTSVISGHHLPILLANNVPCTVNSDNASFYKSSLSHDFYQVMIGSEAMTLQGWKQLAIWSLDHSCMGANQLKIVKKEWSKRWDEFCLWIVQEYGPLVDN
ncbi:putative adenosine deaminase family protein [Erysiphe necator]|uniref:Putative adenosine deaminase family protein n=1 Tax=Uncinula necator TaxID=52586 RepID=A0A0B1PAF0_UNCNE|nr:putative adenosine deaminase family protein [Erysiphe necator]